jgi:TRAP-type mannitol/chloroaromatic compound transport system substrate-binding protein
VKKKNLLKLIIGVTLIAALAIALPLAGGCAPKAAVPTPEEPTPTPEEPTPTPTPEPEEPEEELEVYTWRVTAGTPPMEVANLVRPWCDQMEEESGGQLKFEVYGYGEIMPMDQVIAGLQTERVELSYACGLDLAAPVDVIDLECLAPFMQQSAVEALVLFELRGLDEIFAESYHELGGIIYLGMWTADPNHILSNRPIRTVDDLKGLKINTFAPLIRVLEPFGATAVWLPPEEFYLGAQTGVIDALSWGGAKEGVGNGWVEVLPYLLIDYLPGAATPNVLVSESAFNKLPPNLQGVIKHGIDILRFRALLYYYDGEVQSRPLYAELTSLPEEDLQQLYEVQLGLWDEYSAKSPRMAEAIAIIKDYNAEVEAMNYYR